MVEAAGVVPRRSGLEGLTAAPDTGVDTRLSEAKDGGGGGSRTRVRKHVVVGLYMRVRFFILVPGVRKRRKTAGNQTR
jgi:hypothetical protein